MSPSRILIVVTLSAVPIVLRGQEPCLDKLPGDLVTTPFDTAFDRNSEGNSFSCDIYLTATQAREVLEDFRFGFLYDSLPHIERSVKFPLQVNVMSEGVMDHTLSLRDFSEWQDFKSDNLEKAHRAVVACATLENVGIYKREGGFSIALGFVWFILSGEDVRVRSINLEVLPDDLVQRSCLGK